MKRDDTETELTLALELIDAADWAHAVHHLAAVAAASPHEPRLHDAVERLCRAVDDPCALVPLEEGQVYLGSVVLRGLIEARCGRLTDALSRLLQAEAYDPEPAYLNSLRFDAMSTAALLAIDAERVGTLLVRLVSQCDDRTEPLRSATLTRANTVIELLLDRHAGSEMLAFAAAILWRRLGRHQNAIALADEFLERTPSYRMAVALANVHRDLGSYELAAAAYECAQQLDPGDDAATLDLGDMYGSIGSLEDAVASYAAVLDREAQHAWALPSWHYYRWLLHDEPGDAARLAQLAEDPSNARARALQRAAAIYETTLPPRPESLLKALEHGGTSIRVAVSSLEAPSAVAVARQMAPGLPIEVGETPGVDPRLPRREVKMLLWRYRTTGMWPFKKLTHEAEALAGRRPLELTRRIEELAREPYSAAEWYRRAGSLAEAQGETAVEVCCVRMVSFGSTQAEYTLQDWVFRVQVAAAFVLARLQDGEQALWDICYGPVDWVSTAAIVALTQVAIEDPARRERISAELLAQISAVDSPIGYMCISLPAAHNLLRVPGLPSDARRSARELRNADLQA